MLFRRGEKTCCKKMFKRGIVEKCCSLHVVKKCCKEVLRWHVVPSCCEGMQTGRFVDAL